MAQSLAIRARFGLGIENPRGERDYVALRQRSLAKRHLYFPIESRLLLTQFKVYALQTIFESASRELGDLLKTATVLVYHDHYEATPPILILQIVADLDSEKFSLVHKRVAKDIALESLFWSDSNIAEYREMIHYEFIPLEL